MTAAGPPSSDTGSDPGSDRGSDPARRAAGWVAHLRHGGTTPWSAWAGPAEPAGGPLPGAQQLELLRRINLAAGPAASGGGAGASTRLADRVLAAPAAGRGKVDLPLVGLGATGFGPRPVDPSTLSAHELLRVASVLLAEDLVTLGPDPVLARRARPWRRRVRLVGDPVLVGVLRADLLARGRPERGPHPLLVVVGAPLDDLLAHTWTQRCFETGTQPWTEWLRFWRERDQLPARADLPASVARWGARRSHVRVVTDLERLPRQLGVRRLPEVRVPSADQAELARRVAAVVGLKVPAAERPALMRTLRGRMPHTGAAPVGVPARERAWVEASAARMARHLRRAGYPVVGDLTDLAPRRAGSGTSGNVDDQQVLDLAIRMLSGTGRASGDQPRVGDDRERTVRR